MTQVRILVATSSIQIFSGSHCVMSIPLRLWESSRALNGKDVWSSRSRTAAERRSLMAILNRVIRETSDVALPRRLLRALEEARPSGSATGPLKRPERRTAGRPGLARAAQRARRLWLRPVHRAAPTLGAATC